MEVILNFFVASFLIVILVLVSLILSKMNSNQENYRGCDNDGNPKPDGIFSTCKKCKGAYNCTHSADSRGGCQVNSSNECVNA